MILLASFIYGLIHALRGAGVKAFAKFYAGIYFAAVTIFLTPFGGFKEWTIIYLVTYGGYYLGISLGWGKYFNVAFPSMTYVNETEVKFIDTITTKIYKNPINDHEFEVWCFIAFFFRSFLFYPLFIMLSYFNIHGLIFGLGVLLMPVVYWARRFTPVVYSIRVAEFTYGSILGLLILLTLMKY